ncbi:hypothetical protein BJV82DRAFT_74605 [Fennellomyces sp. T-0311]|nr:hypothetical protein BJV82DRAFT_74605 [Fennellomyces sp. T-0311]
MKLLNILACLLATVALILQIIALCGNLPGLHSVYFVRVDAYVSSSLLDRIRHNIFGIPDSLTFAAFVICQTFKDDYARTVCTNPGLGYRFDAGGLLGVLEDAIPEELHTTLSVAQGGILIPSVCLAFTVTLWCVVRLCIHNDRLVCCLIILGILALIFALASLAVQVVGYHAVRDALSKAQDQIPGQTVQLVSQLGPSIWLTVGAIVALVIVVIIFAVQGVVLRRRRRNWQQEERIEMSHV